MDVIRVPHVVQNTCSALRQKGKSVGAVFTMGALHAGHMSLIENARRENDFTVASVFVNPTQFGPNEDLDAYPRDYEGDAQKLRTAGIDLLFQPTDEAMYRPGALTTVSVGELGSRLCGAFRPAHFQGVATVVTKLLNITQCTRAYFGQKDFQQVRVIEQVVRDLNMPVEIVRCPIFREPDGLAMSSRNAYLTPEERAAAPILHKTLIEGAAMLKAGRKPMEVEQAMHKALKQSPLVAEVQYAGVFDPESMEVLREIPTTGNNGSALLAGAIMIGSTRLIDNVLI